MGYLAGLLAVSVLALILFGVSGCSPRDKGGREPTPVVVKTVDEIKVLDRQAIRDLLKKLSNAPPPTAKMGAMCYEPAAQPERAEYICPTCGERSIYGPDLGFEIEWTIPACRREFKELEKMAGAAAKLDESQFCRKCSGEIKEPKFVLTIQLGEGQPKVTSGVTSNDLRILREFLSGNIIHKGEADDESPLRDQLPRLEELLGIELK